MNTLLLFRVLHLTGIFMLILSLGAIIVIRSSGLSNGPMRKIAFATNGIGLLLALIAGFMLIPQVVGSPWPLWVFLKMVIWLAFAALTVLINRKPHSGGLVWWAALGLAIFAAYLAHFKPF